MAIVKSPLNIKITVGDYKDAAVRHFNTCKVLWRYVSLPETSNLKNLNEDDILKNIFYLSGYVTECAMKYRYFTDCHSLNDTDDETLWGGITWRRHFSFISLRDRTWSEGVVQDLSNSRSLPDYIKALGNVTPLPSLIPTEETHHDMLASWEPTIRYYYETNGLILNKADIESFFQATKSLLQNFNMI
jgi:hypothetical protein